HENCEVHVPSSRLENAQSPCRAAHGDDLAAAEGRERDEADGASVRWVEAAPQRQQAIPASLIENLSSLPRYGERGAYITTATPITQISAPSRSYRSGRVPSMPHPQSTDRTTNTPP